MWKSVINGIGNVEVLQVPLQPCTQQMWIAWCRSHWFFFVYTNVKPWIHTVKQYTTVGTLGYKWKSPVGEGLLYYLIFLNRFVRLLTLKGFIQARANLLDVMLASSGSSGASSNSSNSSDSGDEPADYQHLHRLHRFRRQKKGKSAISSPMTELSSPV
jgi:hypothetical protein